MILGIGTDLAEVDRIKRSVDEYGDRFLHRVYTERERHYAMSKKNYPERLAARFAAKEAGMKALGTGWRRGVTWKDFEVVNESGGRPTLHLTGVAQQIAAAMGAKRSSISRTHTVSMACAVGIREEGK